MHVTANIPNNVAKNHGTLEGLGNSKDFTESLSFIAFPSTLWVCASASDPRRDGQALVW